MKGLRARTTPRRSPSLSAGGSLGDAMWTAIGGDVVYYFAAQKVIQPVDPFVARGSTWVSITRTPSRG